MTDTNGTFWWANPRAATGRRGVQIKPYFAAVTIENVMLEEMGELNARLLQQRNVSIMFDDTNRPDELRWFHSKVPEKSRNLPDFFEAHFGALIISEAMRDVLVQFNLGQTQIIELPLYELSTMDKMGNTEADRSKKDPRRWFLLHVVDYKPSVVVDASEMLRKRYADDDREVYAVYSDETPVVAVDGNVAADGPDIWLDTRLRSIFFFSDRLKRAIQSAKLRAPILNFKPCKTVLRDSLPPESQPPQTPPSTINETGDENSTSPLRKLTAYYDFWVATTFKRKWNSSQTRQLPLVLCLLVIPVALGETLTAGLSLLDVTFTSRYTLSIWCLALNAAYFTACFLCIRHKKPGN